MQVEQTTGNPQSTFTLSVEFFSYDNPTSSCRVGSLCYRCCNDVSCGDDCQNYFIFCLRSPDTERGDDSELLSLFETGVVNGGDNIDFAPDQTDGFNIPNSFTFNSHRCIAVLNVKMMCNVKIN